MATYSQTQSTHFVCGASFPHGLYTAALCAPPPHYHRKITIFRGTHEWVAVAGDIATLGITNFAQESLSDVVFVELPEVDDEISEGQEVAVIESVKAAGEIKTAVAGTVVEVNEQLVDTPELVNEDPMGEAWFIKVRLTDTNLNALLSEDE